MFFPKISVPPHGLEEPHAEIYLLAIQEAMEQINATCRYQHPEEFLDVLPEKEFEVTPNEDCTFSSVRIRGGVSITDALDSIFHDIKSDVGGGPKVIDCAVANCLVAAQAARCVLGDKNFNAYVDKMRGGRAKLIILRPSPLDSFLPYLFDKFGVVTEQHYAPASCFQSGEVRFGHMLQLDKMAYSAKHDYLTSLGFHHIVLPNGSVLAFAPDVGGKFKSLKELANYMLLEMNKDLSSEQWCHYITLFSEQLKEKMGIRPRTSLIKDLRNFVTNHLSVFLETIEIISAFFHVESLNETPKINLDDSTLLFLKEYFSRMNITITEYDVSYIVSLYLSLHTHILPKNLIKIPECAESYDRMVKQPTKVTSVFNIHNFPSKDIQQCQERTVLFAQ